MKMRHLNKMGKYFVSLLLEERLSWKDTSNYNYIYIYMHMEVTYNVCD
jgi:hypothetical protein